MYAKIFRQMYDGTLATKGPWQALVTFQQMLILCDPEGVIDMTPEAISRFSTVPLDVIKIGIEALEAEDPESRREDDDGRRITRLDDHRTWGWQITNFTHYRDMQNNIERREYFKNFKRKQRLEKMSTECPTMSTIPLKKTKTNTKEKEPIAPNEISFDAETGTFVGITADHVAKWGIAYPAVDLKSACSRAAAWIEANPKNRKSNYGRYLTNWLTREQDRAGRVR